MVSDINDIRIIGISAAVSGKWQSVKEMTDENEALIQKFIKKTGVSGRYSASANQTTSDFCCAAVEALLAHKHIDRKEIGALVYVTQSPDYRMPATAHVLQHRLALSANCMVFDVNLGCSGYVYGLNILASIMSTGNCKYGILLAGDTAAREFSIQKKEKTGHTSGLLFGDAGSATILEKAENAGSMSFILNSNGNGYKYIIAPYAGWRNPDGPGGRGHVSQMDEIGVFNFATEEAPRQILSFMENNGTCPDDYDCLVLHQANLMIMQRVAKKAGFPEEKNLISMDRFANTSSASIPLTLVDKYGQESLNRRINALCCGFGVGLSWGTTCVSVQSEDIIPLVHTDEYYSDGFRTE